MCALLLKPKKESRGPLAGFFRWFNRVFARTTEGYISISALLIRKAALSLCFLAIIAVLAVFIGNKLPSSFLPDEDQGYLFVGMQLPDAASLQRTSDAATKVEHAILTTARCGELCIGRRLQPFERHAKHVHRVFLRHAERLG